MDRIGRGRVNFFALFHLNLAFSSIPAAARATVIARCYRPLLRLAEVCGPITIEATGFTLEEIQAHDPDWIAECRALMAAGKVVFVGSGYAQIIGPLVPAAVTERNLALGSEIYRRLLGATPDIALVNEQAYGGGLVGLYLDAGYRTLLMDWDNPASWHGWKAEARFQPARALGADGRSIGLIWTDTVAFQILQRYAHGDISLDDYVAFVATLQGAKDRAICLYASDAEIFDYRPGRYRTEEVFDTQKGSEWERLERAFRRLQAIGSFVSLASLAARTARRRPLRLETPECPVPVKKQRKYNLSRWAVSGRDDLALNAACARIEGALVAASAGPEAWKELCFLWSSDFRTHITDARWQDLKTRLAALAARYPAPALPPVRSAVGESVVARSFDIDTKAVQVRLDRRRGGAFETLAFRGGAPLAGRLPLGVFADIAWQADWYTGNCVFEAPGEHKVTDLEWAEARRWREDGDEWVSFCIPTPLGPVEKTLRISASRPRIDFDIVFRWESWGKGSLRLGFLTLLPGAFVPARLTLTTHNGGKTPERFALAGHEIEHGAPVSFLVSASQGLGLTEGWAELSDGRRFLRLSVDRATAPLMGLLTHRSLRGGLFCQLALSALELDDTRKPDALVPDRACGHRRFRFRLEGGDLSATC